jgi:hypothetical protein
MPVSGMHWGAPGGHCRLATCPGDRILRSQIRSRRAAAASLALITLRSRPLLLCIWSSMRKCRVAKKAPRKCEHGRSSKCKDCGTGYCKHGRRKGQCKDCGTGYCEHNRRKGQCKDCGTGYCEHTSTTAGRASARTANRQ